MKQPGRHKPTLNSSVTGNNAGEKLGCRVQSGWLFVPQHPTGPPPYFISDFLNYSTSPF